MADEAWKRRHLDYRQAADYLFGAEYLESLRAVRARVPESGTIHFIDVAGEGGAAPYFALHYLAPRRLVRLGTTRERSLGWLRRRAPEDVTEILLIDGEGAPVRLVPIETLPEKGPRRVR